MSQKPTSSTALVDTSAVTSGESSFFHDIHPFRGLVESVIPEILTARGTSDALTIWCAACSSGQEPYSVAIAVTEAFPELVRSGRLRILATDLAPSKVERTRAGRFTQREVSLGLPVRHMLRHFQQDGTEWVASRQLRQVLDVRVLDLTGSWRTVPKCDIVFLRNELPSFDPEAKRRILERIRSGVLRPAGHLFLGSAESVDEGWTRRTTGRSVTFVAAADPVAAGFPPRRVGFPGPASRPATRLPGASLQRSPVRTVGPGVGAPACLSVERGGGPTNPDRSAAPLPLR